MRKRLGTTASMRAKDNGKLFSLMLKYNNKIKTCSLKKLYFLAQRINFYAWRKKGTLFFFFLERWNRLKDSLVWQKSEKKSIENRSGGEREREIYTWVWNNAGITLFCMCCCCYATLIGNAHSRLIENKRPIKLVSLTLFLSCGTV